MRIYSSIISIQHSTLSTVLVTCTHQPKEPKGASPQTRGRGTFKLTNQGFAPQKKPFRPEYTREPSRYPQLSVCNLTINRIRGSWAAGGAG
ncbi:hypothetical protein EYC84_008317 [Monilinia fructicola]|uniref:Uncharacterized protein n=1 Tax=Monilinia fructicola TaxID=38448 RepID=A0A5M9JJF2_MONFR|nr:hypothetical protein EYC84_008317 [Monilinia fructicola]